MSANNLITELNKNEFMGKTSVYHILAATLDFTSFFTTAFLGATQFFYSWAVLD